MTYRSASGIITNYHYDDSEFYTTKEADEVIFFKDDTDVKRQINDWIITADSSDLLITLFRYRSISKDDEIGYESSKIVIKANSSYSNSGVFFNGIKVYGDSGQKIKWVANQI